MGEVGEVDAGDGDADGDWAMVAACRFKGFLDGVLVCDINYYPGYVSAMTRWLWSLDIKCRHLATSCQEGVYHNTSDVACCTGD